MGERNTSLDILKIIATLQVVIYHVSRHCGYGKPSKPAIFALLCIFSKTNNFNFMMISGFVGAKTRFLLSKVIPIILEYIIYSLFCYFCGIFFFHWTTFSAMGLINVLFPLANSLCWYILPYIIWQVIFSLIYPTLKIIDARYFISIIFIILVVYCMPWVGFYKYVSLDGHFSLGPFFLMGFIGSYFSYHYKERPKYIIVIIYILLFYYNYLVHQKPEYFRTEWRLLRLFGDNDYMHLPSVVLAIAGFYLTISIKGQRKYQSFIQRIAQCSLAVYILHYEYPFDIYRLKRAKYYNRRHGPYYIPLIMFCLNIVIAGTFIDIVRQHLFNTFIFKRNYYQIFAKYFDHIFMNQPLE